MRHNEGCEEGKTVIGRDSKISVGSAVAVFVTLLTGLIWGRAQFEGFRSDIQKIWTYEDQQNWSDSLRRNNPNVSVPDPLDIRRMRQVGTTNTSRPLATISSP